ncbi:MAG: YggT family protein [Candidatus Nanopelagicales bacterium]|nr:YggT family protein [Candidatus Nanopelagicales bacterium]
MSGIGQLLATVLWIYWLLFIIRIVFDLVQSFARSWRPRGLILLLAEAIYTVTDPPLRLLRRVIPPLRLGAVRLDLAFLIVLILLQVLINFALMI